MRISYQTDYGSVWLDGQQLAEVVQCDTAQGWAEVLERDENGNLVIDYSIPNDPCAKTKIVRGHVRFSSRRRLT